MRPLHALPVLALALCGAALLAQDTAAPAVGEQDAASVEQGLTPASKAPDPVQAPDPRLDATPHSTVHFEPYYPAFTIRPDQVMGVLSIPDTPPGMLARPAPGDPAMVYFALPHRAGNNMSAGDDALLSAREADLARAAAYSGFDLHQSGWMLQQSMCPATQPNAAQLIGVPAGYGGQGALLLHFVREQDGRVWSFTAVVPRDDNAKVLVTGVAHNSVESKGYFLSGKTSGAVANHAIPPGELYADLQPNTDWIATSACVAEVAGGYPHIPNDPAVDSAEVFTAPPPRLEVSLNGERHVIFSDRIDATHFTIWQENVSAHGQVKSGSADEYRFAQPAVTNPPLPKAHMRPPAPEPSIKIGPPPPDPTAGLAASEQ